jgi:putative addiction module killer protein
VRYTRQARIEQTETNREWINALKDRTGRARIQVRVDRLIHGNPGQHRDLTDGVSELKIDVGPGYLVYYMQRGNRILLLLAGGDKSTQQKDIETAIYLAQNFQE